MALRAVVLTAPTAANMPAAGEKKPHRASLSSKKISDYGARRRDPQCDPSCKPACRRRVKSHIAPCAMTLLHFLPTEKQALRSPKM